MVRFDMMTQTRFERCTEDRDTALTNTGRNPYDLQPKVLRTAYRSLYGRKTESKVNSFKMRHNLLKQHRISMIDNPTCDCGTDRKTPKHTIFHCQKNAVLRDILIDTIELSFVASQTPTPDRIILNLKTILGYNSHLPTEAVRHNSCQFILQLH